jgi:hypothetical protein
MAANPTIATAAVCDMKRAGSTLVLIGIGTTIIGLTFLFVSIAAAQQTAATPDSNAIMGFESLGTWDVRGSAAHHGFMVTMTSDRTQGSAAYSISNPPEMLKLISQPIASSATALTGIGNTGALLQIDIQIPTQKKHRCEDDEHAFKDDEHAFKDDDHAFKDDDHDYKAEHSGHIEAHVSSPSRGLHHVLLGRVEFSQYRAGIYNTISFDIPDEVSSALNGAIFSDLRFEFEVKSREETTGAYLFDNLRVHSVQLEQSPAGTPPPPGYGGSVNLVVFGNAPVSQASNLGPTQIPNSFHLKMGSAGATTVQLQLGLDGNPSFTCTYAYGPDATDTSGASYILQSCTEGFEAGDLVNSNWVHLEIIGGDSTQQIRAQLAMNPIGDLTGTGLLPPMPTFWGDANTCVPAPAPGWGVTTSASCTNQVAEANQIVTNFFEQVSNFNPAPTWIVTPVPEFALRQAPLTPSSNARNAKSLSLTPEDASNGPISFSASDDVNPGGSWDVGWNLNGSLTPTAVAGTDENITTFNAGFNAHAVLFGKYVPVMDAEVSTETDSQETTPNSLPGKGTGNVSLTVFGSDVPGGGSVDPSVGFNLNPQWTQDFDLPSLDIWIFSITLGATADTGLTASSPGAASGLSLNITPKASLGVHLSGGVDITLPIVHTKIASGTVDAKVNLVTLSTPTVANANWAVNNSPAVCAITVNGSGSGEKIYSGGSGAVNLNATFGICPHCYTGSWEVTDWESIESTKESLFNDSLASKFRLPPGLAACGTWQGTASDHILKCTQRDSNGCCLARSEKVGSVPVTATFSQNGTGVSGAVYGENVTGTNINGIVSLSTAPIASVCGPIEVPAVAIGTISSDSSTFSGQVYINNNHNVAGDFALQYTGPQ